MSVTIRSEGARRVDVGAARDVLLEDVVLNRARELGERHALAPATATYSASRMIAVELIVIDVETWSSGMPSKSVGHVLDRVDRDADAADFAGGHRVVRVVAHLRRQVERDAEPADALCEQVAVAGVRFGGRAEARVLAHRPEPAAVHGRLDAARERKDARHFVAGLDGRPDCPAARTAVAFAAFKRTVATGGNRCDRRRE